MSCISNEARPCGVEFALLGCKPFALDNAAELRADVDHHLYEL